MMVADPRKFTPPTEKFLVLQYLRELMIRLMEEGSFHALPERQVRVFFSIDLPEGGFCC